MAELNFKEALASGDFVIPSIREGVKVKGVIIKKTDYGVLVNCDSGSFTGIILSKEVKGLERSGVNLEVGRELEAEILNLDARDAEGYYIISISKLLQYDVWKKLLKNHENDELITVVPTEANLGGLLFDIHGIKGFIPLSQLAPVNYPRVEDGDQEKIFERLLSLIGKEFKVRIINLDEENKRIILSEREALREEREEIMANLKINNEYDGVVSGISSYGLFVTIGGGIEGLVHISEITFGHVDNINKLGKLGDKLKVRVIGYEEGKISLSSKQMKDDPWSIIPQKYKIGDTLKGEVVRFVPYGVFIRVYNDINGLIHLSELSDKPINNPIEVVKLGQVVTTKVILLDPKNRKIGLTMRSGDRVIKNNKPGRKFVPKKPETKLEQRDVSEIEKEKESTKKESQEKTEE